MNIPILPTPAWLVGWGLEMAWGAVIIGIVWLIFRLLLRVPK